MLYTIKKIRGDSTINIIAQEYLHPILKPLGFKRKGLVWNRVRNEFVDVIKLQSSKYSNALDKIITGNVALAIPEFSKIIFNREPSFFIDADGIFNIRFGRFYTENAFDKWWTVNENNLSEVGKEFCVLVADKAIPFLDSFNDFKKISQNLNLQGWSLKIPYYHMCKALVFWKLGDNRQFSEELSLIYPVWKDKVEEIENKLGIYRVE